MTELHRGQHPHAIDDILKDTGPSTWTNKIENDRTRWEERFVADEIADGYNPIAQYNGLKAGQSAEARQKISHFDSLLKQKEAKANKVHANHKLATNPWMKPPLPAPSQYGIQTEDQRLARVKALESRLGVDKAVLVSSPIQIDTTAQAGHHTASLSDGYEEQVSTMRGGTWPVSSDYFRWETDSIPRVREK
eukprot:CAMPEP_0174725166 /NCGR_PEP_ID=MMETSP1094-20130205/44931_1 /TAXON_ID=156173 /ORGANISM="Chrysochromulina brevifilum, Strain UTEX LB 985" /LENGTH=191 /DNA_ID=CAMNT_0015926521 /DNA_START=70 /DNA_END=645 /DNA_ORIENTATION=+